MLIPCGFQRAPQADGVAPFAGANLDDEDRTRVAGAASGAAPRACCCSDCVSVSVARMHSKPVARFRQRVGARLLSDMFATPVPAARYVRRVHRGS